MSDLNSYATFSRGAIKTGSNSDSASGWVDLTPNNTNEQATPLSAKNLNVMLDMLVYIKNIIGEIPKEGKVFNVSGREIKVSSNEGGTGLISLFEALLNGEAGPGEAMDTKLIDKVIAGETVPDIDNELDIDDTTVGEILEGEEMPETSSATDVPSSLIDQIIGGTYGE